MKHLNFILNGFGFMNGTDFVKSTMGHLLFIKTLKVSAILSTIASVVESLLGIQPAFITAYCVLIVFEWLTGIFASAKKGRPHESRKMGRMLLKIAAYSLPIYILNQFARTNDFPVIMGWELDPFNWLYWAVLIGIIWQLLVSLLENLDVLGVVYARKLIKIINSKLNKKFDIKDESTK